MELEFITELSRLKVTELPRFLKLVGPLVPRQKMHHII